MNSNIIYYFKKSDPTFYKVLQQVKKVFDNDVLAIKQVEEELFFTNLCRSIINQQISNKVGLIILGRFLALFNGKVADPKKLLKIKDEKLREIGISRSKIVYLKDLAQNVMSKELKLADLKNLEKEEIIEQLVKVKGIGVWTAEMFMIFSLGREDIFSHGDFALKKAILKIYNLENPTKQEIEEITKNWIPYRSYASKILWRSLSVK